MDQFHVSCKPTYSIIFTTRMPVIAHANLIITFQILDSWIELPLGAFSPKWQLSKTPNVISARITNL
jgi:hypothetical protein